MDTDRITGEAKKMAGQAEGAIGDLTGDAKTQGQGRAREAGGTAENLYGQAKDAARQAADQVSDVAGDLYERGERYAREGMRRYPQAGRYAREGTRAVTREIEESPMMAILIAGVVGYAMAWLIHGRR